MHPVSVMTSTVAAKRCNAEERALWGVCAGAFIVIGRGFHGQGRLAARWRKGVNFRGKALGSN